MVEDKTPQQILEELVRYVARAFYSDVHIVLLEALLRYNYIKDVDLANKLNIRQKDLRRELTVLRDDLLVQSEEKSEKSQGGHTHQYTYWFIDYKLFIDAINLRIHKIHKMVKEKVQKDVEYICSECGAIYTVYDVSNIVQMDGSLACEECKGEVNEVISEKEEDGNLEKVFEEQLKPIIDRLKATEKFVIQRSFRRDAEKVMTHDEFQRERIRREKLLEQANNESRNVRSRMAQEFKVEIKREKEIKETKPKPKEQFTVPFFLQQVKEEKYNSIQQPIETPQPTTIQEQIPEIVKEEEEEEKEEEIVDFSEYYEHMTGKDEEEEDEEEEFESVDNKMEDVFVTVRGVQKRLKDITSDDEENMTLEEYEKYYSLKCD